MQQRFLGEDLTDLPADLLGAVSRARLTDTAYHRGDDVGEHIIRCQQYQKTDADGVQRCFGNTRKQAEKRRSDQLYDQHAADAKQHAVSNPDAPLQIHRARAVVPPAGMENLFHVPAHEIFQCAAEEEADEECFKVTAVAARREMNGRCDEYCACTVNRAVRTDKKAAVDEAVELYVFQCDLHDPAGDRKYHEKQNKVAE